MTQLAKLGRGLPEPARRALRAKRADIRLRQQRDAANDDLGTVVGRLPEGHRRHLMDRMTTLLDALGRPADGRSGQHLAQAVEAVLADADGPQVWLALAVLTGELPVDDDVVEAQRRLRLDGPGRVLSPPVVRWLARTGADDRPLPVVEVLCGGVTVDLHHTSETELATGIQRVARETAQRWERDHDIALVGWTTNYLALRRLDPRAHRRALGNHHHGDGTDPVRGPDAPTVIVPWQGVHVTVELATEEPRTARMQALARHSGNRTGMIGFDCVPLTTAETAAESMGGAFARLLACVRHIDRLATISEGAAVEYRGWRAMLAGTGLHGPDVMSVPLPVEAKEPTAAALEQARSQFGLGSLPLVLCVGSHEPRKNHLAVMHAAELLWREGLEFSLVFVGGNAWKSERFLQTLVGLRDGGRPIQSLSALSDDLLWAAYQTAHVVLFPSLNEGFGLPVAEGLASGTPVITSGFGSMAEIAEQGGALLVDPRDDHDIAAALRRVLSEPTVHADLAAQARLRPRRSWDTYAGELWSYLVRQ